MMRAGFILLMAGFFALTCAHTSFQEAIAGVVGSEAVLVEASAGDVQSVGETLAEAARAEDKGDFQNALALYREALSKEPGRSDVLMRIADIEAALGNTDGTEEALLEASRIPGAPAAVYMKLSRLYSMRELPLEALAAVNRAVELEPDNEQYLDARAMFGNWAGDYGAAADSYRRLMTIRPGDDTLLLSLARNRSWAGDIEASVKYYGEYTKKHPKDKDALVEYARVLAWRGSYGRAIHIVGQIEGRFGESAESAATKALVLAWGGRPREALVLINKMPDAWIDAFNRAYLSTVAFHFAARAEDALESLKTVEELKPGSKEANDLGLLVKTPLRSNLRAGAEYYADNDDLSIFHTEVSYNQHISPYTTLSAGVELDDLTAKRGSGLERKDGGERASHYRGWLGLKRQFSDSVSAGFELGASETEKRGLSPAYSIHLEFEPLDTLKMDMETSSGYYIISPRASSLGLRASRNRLALDLSPSLDYKIVASFSYDFFSDDNTRWEAVFAPRRAVARTGNYNLDLGLSAYAFGFDRDLDNGYYDPGLYERYMAVLFGYWKISDDSGANFSASAGIQKDDDMDGYRFGWSADFEFTFGIFGGWMLKAGGGALNNMRQASGAYRGYVLRAGITRRL